MIARVPIVASDEDVRRVSHENPGWHVERERDGSLVMTPTGTRGGARSALVLRELIRWDADERGIVFDSSTGFLMPDGAILSPDAAWIERERWDRVAMGADDEGFLPIVPDIAIEVVSASDSAEIVRRKAERYVAYGAAYALVIDPKQRTVTEYGERPPGLDIDCERIYKRWTPLAQQRR